MISKPQSNCSGLYVNIVTFHSNSNLNSNLTAAAYTLTMVTLRKPLWFEPQQSVQAIRLMKVSSIQDKVQFRKSR